MKKFIMLILAVALCITTLTGCNSDPVAKELEKFINKDMVEINKLYEEILSEDGKLSVSPQDKDAAIKTIEETILPNVKKATGLVNDIDLDTQEVRALRSKFASSMENFANAYEEIISYLKTGDSSIQKDAYTTLNEAFNLMAEYDKQLEKLLKETGIAQQQ